MREPSLRFEETEETEVKGRVALCWVSADAGCFQAHPEWLVLLVLGICFV